MLINRVMFFGCFVLLSACGGANVVEDSSFFYREFGKNRKDPYHWLKDKKRSDPKVIDFLQNENRRVDEYFQEALGLQDKLYQEMKSRVVENDHSVPYLYKGYLYYSRYQSGMDYQVYCRRKSFAGAKEEIILDLNQFFKGKKNFSLGTLLVSPDQNLVAFTADEQGREVYSLFIKNLSTGSVSKKMVSEMTSSFEWAGNSRKLLLTKMNKSYRANRVFLYDIDSEKEKLLFQDEDTLFDVWVDKSSDEKILFMGSSSFDSSEIYYHKVGTPLGEWRLIQRRTRGLSYRVDHKDGYFFILNNYGAPNFKISRVAVSNPGLKMWSDFILEDSMALITKFFVQGDRLVYIEIRNGQRKVRYVNWNSRRRFEIQFDEPVYHISFGDNPDFNSGSLRLNFSSPITPPKVYDFDFKKTQFTVRKEQKIPKFDSSKYEAKRLQVEARDGQQILVTLLGKKKNLKTRSPGYLFGYGAYGYTLKTEFDSNIFSLVDRGILVGWVHVRGGQAKGRSWYDQGRLKNKKNTFNDFEDVSRGLIGAGYIHPDKLAIKGRSAGGLLVGAVLNQAPRLFRAAVAEVPFVDVVSTLLDSSLRFSLQEYRQWGDPKNEINYKYILSYSPYDQIKANPYPAILATGGLFDSRVNYWEPAKWIARIRKNSTSGRPLLLRTKMNSGHKASFSRYAKLKERAETQAFVIKELGVE